MEIPGHENLKALRSLLLSARQKLERQLEIAESATRVVALDQTSIGRVSRMDAMQQQSMAVSTRAKATTSLRQVNNALLRLKNDDYGFCNNCDEGIDLNRLMVQPEASFCLKCQHQRDLEQV